MKGFEARIAVMQAGLSRSAAFVALRILDAQGLKEGVCTLSVTRLARDCGLPVSTAKRALKELSERGALEVEGASGQRARRRLVVDALTRPTGETGLACETGLADETGGSHGLDPTRPTGETPPGPPVRPATERDLKGTERDVEAPGGAQAPATPDDVLRESTDLAVIAEGAYQRAIEASGGIHGPAPKWRADFVAVGRLAAAHVTKHGGTTRGTLEAWAKRYVSERRSRRPDWWLERCAAWAGSDTERGAATDELDRLLADLERLESARNAAVVRNAIARADAIARKQDTIRDRIARLRSAA